MTDKKGASAWIARTERATRRRVPSAVAAAKSTFARKLSRPEQLALLEELVETRSAELCRAYESVIDVAYGFGRRRSPKTGRSRIKPVPCVTFIVKRKRKQVRADERLPEHLFAYWDVAGERKLCAVPIDVEDASRYQSVAPQGEKIAVKWSRRPSKVATGMITCAVRRDGQPNTLYALSCRHVFSISKKLHPERVNNAEVFLRRSDSGIKIGETRRILGELRDGPDLLSFDAELAEVVNPVELKSALRRVTFSRDHPFITGLPDLPTRYVIVTGRGLDIEAGTPRVATRREIDYERPKIRKVAHRQLIESVLEKPTKGGDSGSPVVTKLNGGSLVGMHIAGRGDLGYMIPAWQLLNPKNYRNVASSEIWQIVNI